MMSDPNPLSPDGGFIYAQVWMFFSRTADISWLFVMKSAVYHSLPLRAAVALYFRQISTIIRAYIATDFTPPVSCTIGDAEPTLCESL